MQGLERHFRHLGAEPGFGAGGIEPDRGGRGRADRPLLPEPRRRARHGGPRRAGRPARRPGRRLGQRRAEPQPHRPGTDRRREADRQPDVGAGRPEGARPVGQGLHRQGHPRRPPRYRGRRQAPRAQGRDRDLRRVRHAGLELTPRRPPHDSGEHGTHTAATIAGRPVQGRNVGMAPDAMLASALVIEGGNAVARVLGGMDWAVGQHVRSSACRSGSAAGGRTSSRSRGSCGATRSCRSSRSATRDRAPAGRPATTRRRCRSARWTRTRRSPTSRRASASSARRDPLVPDLIGPGVGITSAKPGGGWQDMDGTSMATPHIAGLAALLMQARPKASVGRIERAIFESCTLDPKHAARPREPRPPGRPEGAGPADVDSDRRRDADQGRPRADPPTRRGGPGRRACAGRRPLPLDRGNAGRPG